jgi:hypothetical protein
MGNAGKLDVVNTVCVPEMPMLAIVAAAVPVFRIVKESLVVWPTGSELKSTVPPAAMAFVVDPSVYENSNCPPIAVPARLKLSFPTRNPPLLAPACVGAKVTVKDVVSFTFKVTGSSGPSVIANPVPATAVPDIVVGPAEVFFATMTRELLSPRFVSGKLNTWPGTTEVVLVPCNTW